MVEDGGKMRTEIQLIERRQKRRLEDEGERRETNNKDQTPFVDLQLQIKHNLIYLLAKLTALISNLHHDHSITLTTKHEI